VRLGEACRAELRGLLRGSRTPRIRSLAEFVAEEVVIPKGPSRGSRWRPDVQPFNVPVLAALDDDRWPRKALVGCVQSGKSFLGLGAESLFWLFEHRESVILAAPTIKICRDKFMGEVLPVIAASRYRVFLPRRGAGSEGGFAEELLFGNGARLKFMSAGGGDENRSSYTARVVLLTEVDKMDTASALSREADPVRQIENRTGRYPADERRIYLECTVSVPHGRIWTEFLAGTGSQLLCPCPHCRKYVLPEREHLLGWQQAASKEVARRLAHFACPACGVAITAAERRRMVTRAVVVHRGQTVNARGRAVGDPPDVDTLSIRWTAFHNLFWTAGELGAREWSARVAPDYDAAEREMFQFVWVMPWQPPLLDTSPLDPHVIRKRVAAESLTCGVVPQDAERLTMGIDLGKRLGHWVLVAWRPDARGHLVDYGRFDIAGDTMDIARAVLAALSDLREQVIEPGWRKPGGELLIPNPVSIDAGYMPEAVYEFCRQAGRRYIPALGRGLSAYDRRYRTYTHPTKLGAAVRAIGQEYYISWMPTERLFRADVCADFWKTWLHDRLRTPAGEPGAFELYQSRDPNQHITWSQHITAERPREIFIEGVGEKVIWERARKANHYLDATYNACWAGHLAGVRLIQSRRGILPLSSSPSDDSPSPIVMPDGRPFLVSER
jgi:phage terminase large subunit GpA-like protein